MNENFIQTAKALNLSREEIKQLAINSFEASFLDPETKQSWIKKIQGL
jgi:adenosine deaminase